VISKVRYGNISFTGAGASNVVERIGGDQGDIHFTGIGAYNKVTNSANRGSIYFEGGIGAHNKVKRRGDSGNIVFAGAGISCRRTFKVNIACSSSMLQICCTSKTRDSHIAPSTFIDIHEASSAMNTQISPSIINIQLQTSGLWQGLKNPLA
jgi:hypothetical protein